MDIFVKRPLLALVVSLVLLLAGMFAALKMPVLQFPKIESSSLVINTAYPGASAAVVQGFITDPIERAAMTVPGLDYVDSTTTAGLSKVTLWLKLNENSTAALAELSSRIDQIRYELPSGAEDPSVEVVRADRNAALFYLNVHAENWSRADVTNFLQREVNPQLSSIKGVQKIGIEGGRYPAMRVWLDPIRLAAMHVGVDEVVTALRSNNVIATIGKTENAQQQINLLSNATLQSVDDFNQIVVRETGDTTVRLQDVSQVALGEDRGAVDAKYNMGTSIFISVWPLPGANEIGIGDEVYRRLDEINSTLPDGMHISTGYDGTLYMRNALKEIFITLAETVLIVGLVVLILMGSLRAALVPLVTIPISILGAVAAMYLMGFTLNLLTILAIVLSVGLVVDDAIVVVENVGRHIQMGKGRFEAALISSRELLSPIIAMTFTLAAVYIPIGFVSGLTGSLFQEFSFTLAVAVIISGVVAVTLSPVMSAYVIKDQGREGVMTQRINRLFEQLKLAYGSLLEKSFLVRNQILFFGVFFSLLIIPFYGFSGKELAPVEDQNSINIITEAPPGASLNYVDKAMERVVKEINQRDDIKMTWNILTPSGGFGGIEFVDFHERKQKVQDMLQGYFFQLSSITELKILPVLFPALPTAGNFDVELVVQSNDSYETMEKYAQQLIQAGLASGQFMFVDTNLEINLPQSRLVFDHDRLASLGLTVSQVSDQLAAFIAEQEINRFNAEGKAYRVIPMLENTAKSDTDALMNLYIKNIRGDLIHMSAIASIKTEVGPRILDKFNQRKSFRIFGGILPHVTSDQALTTLEDAAKEILPQGYSMDYAGVSRQLRTEGNSMVSVLFIALLLVYFALIVKFNSLRLPLVVLVGSVPLAISGALIFTFISWTTINIYSQIGFVTLVGLIAKNGILMTEFAQELQHQGIRKYQAILSAAQVRLRPILMTTAATVLGHFPLVLVTGAGAEARNSIGIILVAGMVIGTIFTLIILPNVYLLLARETSSEVACERTGLKTA